MKTLILFSSRDGQTREVAEYLASELKGLGARADVINLHRTAESDWQNYDSVVIGASIHCDHYHAAFQEFMRRHTTRLNSTPSALYSVNLVARKPEKRTPQTNSYVREFLMSSLWRPGHGTAIAGALLYPRYRWYDRVMIQLIVKMSGDETDTNKEVIYTDQEQVARFVREIAQLANKASLEQA